MEFSVPVIVFDICFVEKTFPYTKQLLVNNCLFAVLSGYLFRNDINQVVDSNCFDSNKTNKSNVLLQ